VRDIEGKKMSKSLGNIIDPLEIINEYGTDALRFSLISITAQGQDVFLSKERFEQGRNFANKIWNASRFIMMNLDQKGLSPKGTVPSLCHIFEKENLDLVNRWILSRFYSTLKEFNKNLENYKFNEAANLLYGFFWHEFCDWYLELIKPDIKNKNNQVVMYKVLEKFLRILHPFMPFITEEIWQKLVMQGLSPEGTVPKQESIMIQPLPHIQEQIIDVKLEKQAQAIFNIITQIRNLRSSIEVKPDQKVKISVYPHTKIKHKLFNDNSGMIKNLAKLEDFEFLAFNKRPQATISSTVEDIDIYIHFTGLLDIVGEQRKTRERMSNLEKIIKSKQAMLSNPDFLKRAPKEVVNTEKESKIKLEAELKRLEKIFNELQ
jgi:valyl-tRNA synthetase